MRGGGGGGGGRGGRVLPALDVIFLTTRSAGGEGVEGRCYHNTRAQAGGQFALSFLCQTVDVQNRPKKKRERRKIAS